jgi:very-short-patch-repair endonuclease
MKIDNSDNMFLGASPEIFSRAKKLRSKLTEPEKLLWEQLRNNKLDGYHFRRQHPLKNYIADFYCHQKRLVIELDGSVHDEDERKEYDKSRTEELESFNIKVIRFRNKEVFHNVNSVLASIREELTQR